MSLQPNPNLEGNTIIVDNSSPDNQLTDPFVNQGKIVFTGSSTIITNTSDFKNDSSSNSPSQDIVIVSEGAQLINSGIFSNTRDDAKLFITSGTFSNNGLLNLGGPLEIEFEGSFRNASGASIEAVMGDQSLVQSRIINNGSFSNFGQLRTKSSIDNTGLFYNEEGATMRVQFGSFNNLVSENDFIEQEFLNKGHLLLMTSGNAFVNSEGTLLRNKQTGTIFVGADAWLYNYGTINNEGAIDYWGGINTADGVFFNRPGATLTPRNGGRLLGNVSNQGVHSIINSEYTSHVDGDYDHSSGTFLVGLDDDSFNELTSKYMIDISGDLILNGRLELDDVQNLSLSVNSNVDMIKIGGDLTGTFDGLPEGALVQVYQSKDGEYHDIRISYKGGDGNDISLVTSRNGQDFLGSGSKDTLQGSSFSDYLSTGSGNDELYGALGSDVLTGGEGSDRFVYLTYFESWRGAESRDVITDFSSSDDDKIDLSAIAEDFVFIGSSDFTGAKPEIRFDDGILQLANPDFYTPLFAFYEPDTLPTPIFEIQLLGVDSLSVDDLIL